MKVLNLSSSETKHGVSQRRRWQSFLYVFLATFLHFLGRSFSSFGKSNGVSKRSTRLWLPWLCSRYILDFQFLLLRRLLPRRGTFFLASFSALGFRLVPSPHFQRANREKVRVRDFGGGGRSERGRSVLAPCMPGAEEEDRAVELASSAKKTFKVNWIFSSLTRCSGRISSSDLEKFPGAPQKILGPILMEAAP